jgi:hypothetical protein
LPKQGSTWEEYEDAFACNEPFGRFAIADGASESICAGEWARILCETFTADVSIGEDIGAWLTSAQRRWREQISDQPAFWHVQEKLRDGSYSTFLGVVVETGGNSTGRWRALAMGDSCLFLIHGDTLNRAFPLETAAAINTRPALIGSRQRAGVRATAIQGNLVTGDRLLLMTDALAAWFLTEHEKGRSPWHELERLTEDDFAPWVIAHRKDRTLKNDDVTLLILELGVTTT